MQDELRREGFNVIGGSAYGDRLENDRAYAQRVLAAAGLPIARNWEFTDRAAALDFLQKNPARYVLKFNGPDASIDNYVGRLADGRDVRAMLDKLARPEALQASFVLMEFIEGVEMGVGAYFDGDKFLLPACLDWEHKRFFPGDLGELTGEMGTVVTYERSRRFFERTLGRMEQLMRENGHCGYVNLNTIVNERGIWPLEFTCRFGYPGFAILTPLQETAWGDLFAAMVSRTTTGFATRSGFSVGIVLTLPPFPYSRPQVGEPVGLQPGNGARPCPGREHDMLGGEFGNGLIVLFDGEPSAADRANLHYCELGLEHGELVTSGIYGWAMVVTGVGDSIASAQQRANRLADRVLIPNVRYRRDIGERLIAGDYARVERLGLLHPP